MVPRLSVVAWLAGICALAAPLCAQEPRQDLTQELKNQTFELQFGPSGITSLRRAHDVADTEYVGPNGALGRLIVRYRTAPHGDWKELRDPIFTGRGVGAGATTYAVPIPMPALRQG